MLKRFALTVFAATLTTSVLAQDVARPIGWAPVVESVLTGAILPAYEANAAAAEAAENAMGDLCASPGTGTLDVARIQFGALVETWSAVEMFRMGPARADNRYERMFFWPDRKGVGLRQVQAILADEDQSAAEVETLRGKSVAVQGLLALEFVLFGADSDKLATDPADSFRCRYGHAIAGAIAQTSAEIRDGWTADDGYASVMRNTGPENPVYRSHGEVVQDILRAAREQLQLVRDVKLARSLGKSPEAAVPRQAPFWRSNLTIANMRGNIDAVGRIMRDSGIGALLPADAAWLTDNFAFAIKAADGALTAVSGSGKPWEDAVRDPRLYGKLAYTELPLGDAIEILETRIPAAFNLVTGFNTLDGD